MERFEFDSKEAFVKKLEEVVASGVPRKTIEVFTPYHIHETEHLLDTSQSGVRFFAGAGATTGFIAGFAFTIFTVIDWSLITGGKPMVSIPAFLVIAYELTILFGCLTAFVGFLHLGKVPVIANMFDKTEFNDKFIIEVGRERIR